MRHRAEGRQCLWCVVLGFCGSFNTPINELPDTHQTALCPSNCCAHSVYELLPMVIRHATAEGCYAQPP